MSGSEYGSDEEKSSVEEGEEEEDKTTMVMTCEGNISDPQLRSKLDSVMDRLQSLSNSGEYTLHPALLP